MSATERVLETLLIVGASTQPMTAAMIAQRLDVPLSSAYRHISVLKAYDLITESGLESGGLTLGAAALQLGHRFDRRHLILPAVKPHLQKLADGTQESVGLMQAIGFTVFCVDMVESSQSLRCSFVTGTKTSIFKGASAKALLAFMSETQARTILSEMKSAEAKALRAELETIRALGYAESEGEVDAGIWGVSAPIYSGTGAMEGCITLMVPSFRVGERRDALIRKLCTTASNATEALSETLKPSIKTKPQQETIT
ncbi:IclR family transcriptional regulator [Paracoccus sp. SM22M-07]|uniref:IclR family transcriptional regulator n=1 Tax=Paracoccus sp. SM22M-07 TaxID=1520813 RepID=UPI000930F50F|nr:IclR family transcriptional regulator [Paracoccus sp. SM22M-07]